MNSPAQPWRHEGEKQLLEGLRERYEHEGFTFTTAPEPGELPDFLGSYIPDALARKPGMNVAIEVKSRRPSKQEPSLQNIRRLFEGRSDWQFNVILMAADPLQPATIPPALPSAIRARMAEVAALNDNDHSRAAFVMAWSLLEAASQSAGGERMSRPRSPGTVVQTLAMNGLIEPDMERRMRSLIELRNRVVHGDLTAEPTSADVGLVLTAISDTLAADAA